MAKSYLHIQTVIIAIVCLLAVGATAGYVYTKPSSQPKNPVVVDNTPDKNNIISSSTDWKKQFFDTSTNQNAITGEKIPPQIASDTPLTLTDQVSRDLFARYIELKQNNLDSNKQLVQDSIDQTIANAQIGAAQPKAYNTTDINVSSDASEQAVHSYANTVATAFITNSPKQSPADIASAAFEKNDLSTLSEIDPVITQYKRISAILIATPVPKPLVQSHVDLINGINSMVSISQSLRNIEGDPMQSLISLGNYTNTQTTIYSAMLAIQSYLNINKITFTTTEPGKFFSILTPQ